MHLISKIDKAYIGLNAMRRVSGAMNVPKISFKPHLKGTTFSKRMFGIRGIEVFANEVFEKQTYFKAVCSSQLPIPKLESLKDYLAEETSIENIRVYDRSQNEVGARKAVRKILAEDSAQIEKSDFSFVINRIDTLDPDCRRLANEFQKIFRVPVQINCYITPKRSQTLKIHFDVHDVFIFQVCGTKDWSVYKSYVQAPIKSDSVEIDPRRLRGRSKVSLKRGSFLYIPRGFPHKAVSKKSLSVHLTVGLHPLKASDLLRHRFEQILEQLEETDSFRNSLWISNESEVKSLSTFFKKTIPLCAENLMDTCWGEIFERCLFDSIQDRDSREGNFTSVDAPQALISDMDLISRSDREVFFGNSFLPGKSVIETSSELLILDSNLSETVERLLRIKRWIAFRSDSKFNKQVPFAQFRELVNTLVKMGLLKIVRH